MVWGQLHGGSNEQGVRAAKVTTIGLEREINTFFRLHNPTVIARPRETFPDLPDDPAPATFLSS